MNYLEKFQQLMKNYKYDAYIVPTSDYHNSEYVSEYFKGRKLLSGFTGSAGILVVLQTSCYLWTDGRYFIQAEKELEGSGITLMKMGQPGVPTINKFLNEKLTASNVLAFDGKTLSTNFALSLKKDIQASVVFKYDVDLINEVWEDRPRLPFSVLYKLDTFFSGKSYKEKLSEILEIMKTKNTDCYLISSLEDQAWLYNLRGNDVSCTPVFLSYTLITPEHTTLYVDPNKLDLSIEKYLDECDIVVKPYFEVYEAVKHIKGKKVLLDQNKVNYLLYQNLVDNNTIINEQDPTLLLKSIKNETEIKNTKVAHIKDGVAMTKFMYYLKTEYAKGTVLSELSVSDYLEKLRREQNIVELSFNTICGYKEHAAMMHYSANEQSNYTFDKEPAFLLVDSGGHYLEGSTDITRTFALGSVSDIMKKHFTLVLKSVIALSSVVFLKGCRGVNLDILARGPIWKELIDYKCGTGHGVGYLLSVHEGPNGFRWQIVPERNDSAVFVPGMITTNEPGIYLEGQYGIRTENEMLCVEKGSSEFGDFLGFETITFCPIDLDAIEVSLLSNDEITWLNNYHKQVYEKISPYLSEDEKAWLKEYTKEI